MPNKTDTIVRVTQTVKPIPKTNISPLEAVSLSRGGILLTRSQTWHWEPTSPTGPAADDSATIRVLRIICDYI
jgi:hypothetical protein